MRANRLRVIIDLNFVTGNPQLAAAWAREAERDMPPRSIIGFEIEGTGKIDIRNIWLKKL